MNASHLLTLMTAMACSIATAQNYARWSNSANDILRAESLRMQEIDTPEKNSRIAVGDNPENAVYWNGEKPLPAARLADLLQLSMAAGSTRADDWFTNKAGDVLVFVARPGVGAKHYVFTVFSRKGEEWHKTGTYHFISRHLQICWEEVSLEHGLTIVATSPNKSLRVEKRFDFADARDTFCAYDAPEEAEDMGADPLIPRSGKLTNRERMQNFKGHSSHGLIRYDNKATQTLEAEAALINGPICPEQGRRAFVGLHPDNAPYWSGDKAIPADRVADLLQLSLQQGCTTEECWFTNTSGSVVAFMAQPGNGAGRDEFTIFRKQGNTYHRVGTYAFIYRSLQLRPDEIRLDERELALTYATPNDNTRITKYFTYRAPEDTVCAFDDISERNDCGKDSRPNYHTGLPELAKSPARKRLQPDNATAHLLRMTERELYHEKPNPMLHDSWEDAEKRRHWKMQNDIHSLAFLYRSGVSEGGVVDWMCNAAGDTVVFISPDNVPNDVLSTYTFHVYRQANSGKSNFWHLLGRYKLSFSPNSLHWCPEETYFLPGGLQVNCTDGHRHTGVIFRYNQSTDNVQLY